MRLNRRLRRVERWPRSGGDHDLDRAASIRRVGLVRFNPYGDTGGDYSFVLALLDERGDGVLLTSLYHRDGCRVYAKPVTGWHSAQTLTDEESEAIESSRVGSEGSRSRVSPPT
ncbi:MAG TPA: DUF4446 family protein [Candidatus Nitrosotalea sp.]|nr:DUF4446 family protein [Candidatus Nitrosotalea sp.]